MDSVINKQFKTNNLAAIWRTVVSQILTTSH